MPIRQPLAQPISSSVASGRRHEPAVGSRPHLCVNVVGVGYVAFVIDAYARRILGWRVASTMVTSMVLDSIEQARSGLVNVKEYSIQRRCPPYGSGIAVTSIRFTERLADAGIQPLGGSREPNGAERRSAGLNDQRRQTE